MNENQLQQLQAQQLASPPEPMVDAYMFGSEDDTKTLLYGYNVERNSWHVYLHNGMIHKLVYITSDLPRIISYEAHAAWLAKSLVPNKRTYAQYSDFEFCQTLVALDVHISFANWAVPTRNTHLSAPMYDGSVHHTYDKPTTKSS